MLYTNHFEYFQSSVHSIPTSTLLLHFRDMVLPVDGS